MLAKATMKTDMYNAALTGKSDLYILQLYNYIHHCHHKLYKLTPRMVGSLDAPGIQPDMKTPENMQVIETKISKR